MWPYITAAAEKQAKEMLPDMLEENKPTWMITLKGFYFCFRFVSLDVK
jgi:hypothetical protein